MLPHEICYLYCVIRNHRCCLIIRWCHLVYCSCHCTNRLEALRPISSYYTMVTALRPVSSYYTMVTHHLVYCSYMSLYSKTPSIEIIQQVYSVDPPSEGTIEAFCVHASLQMSRLKHGPHFEWSRALLNSIQLNRIFSFCSEFSLFWYQYMFV